MSDTNQREQQLLVRTVQQEEELRALREQLALLRQEAGLSQHDEPGDDHDRKKPTPPTDQQQQQQQQQQRGGGGRRPQTARPSRGANRGPQTVGASTGSFPLPIKETPLHPTFPLERQMPASNSGQRGPSEGHTAVTMEDKVVCFGGTNGVAISNDVWTYSIAHHRWARVSTDGNVPRGRYGHTSVVYRGTMYVYGGFGPGGVRPLNVHAPTASAATHQQPANRNACGLLGSLYAYSPPSRSWSEITLEHSDPCKGHSATVYRNFMYIFGGCVPEGRSQAVRAIDLERQCWVPIEQLNPQLVAAERSGGGAAADGSGAAASAAPSSLGTTLFKADIPAARSGHTADNYYAPTSTGASNKCSMVVFGGRLRKDAFTNDVCTYDYDSNTWFRQYCGGAMPAARSDHSSAIYKEWLVCLGGYSISVDSAATISPSRKRGASPEENNTNGGQEVAAHPTTQQATTTKVFYSDIYALNLVSCTWFKVEFDGPERPLGFCGHSMVLYESADGQVSSLVIGGFGNASDEMVAQSMMDEGYRGGGDNTGREVPLAAFGPLDDIWSFAIAKAPPRQPQQAKPNQQRPISARGRRPESSLNVDPTKPIGMALNAALRAPSATSHRHPGGRPPFSIQTCNNAGTKVFSEIPAHPPPPAIVRRTPYEIEEIKKRLAVTQLERAKARREELEARYLVHHEPHKLQPDEQEESVDRLYYQQMEWRQQKQKDLEERYLHQAKKNLVDPEMIDDTVLRLTQVPEKEENSVSLRRAVRLGPDEVKESVNRLFTKSLEKQADNQKALRDRYLFQGAEKYHKKADPNAVKDLVDRLSAPRSPTRVH